MHFISVKKNLKIYSEHLKREVVYDIILPHQHSTQQSSYKVLLMNDGQDLAALQIERVLQNLYANNEIVPFVLAAIHTNENRLKEYGTSAMPDYKNRGNMAGKYEHFIIQEFLPLIRQTYQTSLQMEDNYFCGFSLGGLSAMDITRSNPDVFSKVGVFSGSFWWRKKAYEEGYDDENDRIMHVLVRNGRYHTGQKFWFECGTNDEKDDRNGNGIIDSIEDTLDLITELEKLGYTQKEDIVYYEINGGEHNYQTWSQAMPVFLKWLVGK
ncbi:esterase family protein [Emticicia sp. 21SJ11W-3]|uniref:alpha/beta hydrolase n=1 Tax=Emticicia sp. 21SJ11W-3 TaxID=2916755 RepID=UPI00209D2703|nr:alpha/beta hydrolase-fold protein [Emticicia sp. 21SJ11W-3]UTA70291.1 esterase family protein [Emticicia sp. 21SJ11W-3]